MNKKSDTTIQKVTFFLKKHHILEKENKLLVAFSGGADSLCLLDVLHNIEKEYGVGLIAAHLNHNWRGKESEAEAKKAENYCKERNIEFHTETLPPNLPQNEEEARNRRYSFFNRTAQKTNATAILTGHTITDQVETVLYRIIKGTGITGLAGIPEMRRQEGFPSIYRPLLKEVCREDCVEYCEENNLSPSFDPSNYDEKYSRNRIRHSLLPELKTYNSAIDRALIRLSEISGESEEIIQEYIEINRKDIIKDSEKIDTKNFINLSDPLKKRILLDFLVQNNIEYSYERIEDLLNFIKENKNSRSGKTFSIGKELWAFVSSREIKVIGQTKAKNSDLVVSVEFGMENIHPELNISLKIEEWYGQEPQNFPEETADVVYADLRRIRGGLYIRTRKPGDVIRPFGMKEKTKLKKYLINRGIPEHVRDEIPLLVDENEVLWVAGIGISELLRVKKIPTHIISLHK